MSFSRSLVSFSSSSRLKALAKHFAAASLLFTLSRPVYSPRYTGVVIFSLRWLAGHDLLTRRAASRAFRLSRLRPPRFILRIRRHDDLISARASKFLSLEVQNSVMPSVGLFCQIEMPMKLFTFRIACSTQYHHHHFAVMPVPSRHEPHTFRLALPRVSLSFMASYTGIVFVLPLGGIAEFLVMSSMQFITRNLSIHAALSFSTMMPFTYYFVNGGSISLHSSI